MKHLKLFNNRNEYDNYIGGNDVILPNISYCKTEEKVCIKSEFTLTINFSMEEDIGITPPPSFVRKYKNGSTYTVTPPAIEGHTPSIESVTGTMPPNDLVIDVVYSRNTYTIQVQYLYLNGSNAFPPQTFSFKYKDEYHIVPPQLTGFRVNPSEFRGTMQASNIIGKRFFYSANDIDPEDPDTPL